MELVFTGNCFFQTRISQHKEPEYLDMVEIMRNADAAFTNLECTMHDGEDFPAFVAGNGRAGTYLAAPPLMLDELKWLGIDAVYAANNHCANFAEGGILTSIKYLKQSGIAYSGIGESMSAAVAPGYVETENGLVGFISASDWGPRGAADLPQQMPAGVMAGDGGPFFKSRPGVNLLRYDSVPQVDQGTLDALRRASASLGWDRAKAGRSLGGGRSEPLLTGSILGNEKDTDTEFHFMGRKFQLGEGFGYETDPVEEDLQRNFAAVREARLRADVVVATLHDQGGRRVADEEHVRRFARGCIDAGADICVMHGARIGGLEVYKGKLIICGLQPFIFQNEQINRLPQDSITRWGLPAGSSAADLVAAREAGELAAGGSVAGGANLSMRPWVPGSSMMKVVLDAEKKLSEVRIYPLEQSAGSNKTDKGRCVLAEPGGEISTIVLSKIAELSEGRGGRMDIVDGVGVFKAI